MYGLPDGVVALTEEPFNVEQNVSWYCRFPSNDIAAEVLEKAFQSECDPRASGFAPKDERPIDGRARVTWKIRDDVFNGELLVDNKLTPVGFCVEISRPGQQTVPQDMVFNLRGEHICFPRFPAGHQAIRDLVY